MDRYIIATTKPWNIKKFKEHFSGQKNVSLITRKEDLTLKRLQKIKPRYVFFPHWSWIVPEEIWSRYECVTIHETDLPYGRGGSPIQNLIARGHTKTKITAIKIDAGIDTGDIYAKRNVSLVGSAHEIFERVSTIVFGDIIPYMMKHHPFPKVQRGKVVVFKRRRPEQSKITGKETQKELYNLIRMLDAESYPKAYIELGKYRFEITNVKKGGRAMSASVEIYEK